MDNLIDRIINGESPKDVVDEITTTSMIADCSKPMGIVKYTRKKKTKK